MQGIYTVSFSGVTGTVAQDFFEITPADDRPCEILGLFLGQSSDVGDAAEEMLRIEVIRGNTTPGSGGTTPTPRPLDPRSGAAGFTAGANNTTLATAGTPVLVHPDVFNIRVGYQLVLPPEMVWRVDQGQTLLVVRLVQAPVDALTFSGCLYVKES